jgi:hypothetical protein
LVKVGNHRFIIFRVTKFIAGGQGVAGIKADGKTVALLATGNQVGNFGKGRPKCVPWPAVISRVNLTS